MCHSSFRKKNRIIFCNGKRSAIQDSFNIFDGGFETLKNVWKIILLVALIHSGYLVNFFHIEMELGLFGGVSS